MTSQFILTRPRVANFLDMIKIAILFIKTTSKDSSKVNRIKNYILKCDIALYLLIQECY